METLNAGKTWSLVAKMPEDFIKTHLGISLGYDAAHDIFYMIAGGHAPALSRCLFSMFPLL